MKINFKILMMTALTSVTAVAKSNALLTRSDIKYLGSDTGPGHAPYLFFHYKVPNGAIGHCEENNGRGSYTVEKNIAEYTCSVPLISKAEFDAGIGVGTADPTDGHTIQDREFFTSMRDVGGQYYNPKLQHLDELDRVRQRSGLVGHDKFDSIPFATGLYNFGNLNQADQIYYTRIYFECDVLNDRIDIRTICGEEKMSAWATQVSYDPSKGPTLDAVGFTVTGDNNHY